MVVMITRFVQRVFRWSTVLDKLIAVVGCGLNVPSQGSYNVAKACNRF